MSPVAQTQPIRSHKGEAIGNTEHLRTRKSFAESA